MPSEYFRKECQQFLFLLHSKISDFSAVDVIYIPGIYFIVVRCLLHNIKEFKLLSYL